MPFWSKKNIAKEQTEEMSDFDRSLSLLTPDDIAPPKEQRRKTSSNDIVRYILIVLCLAVFAYCMYILFDNMSEYKKAYDIYSVLSDEFFDFEENESYTIHDGVSRLALTSSGIAIPIFSEALKLDDSEVNKYYDENSSHNMEFQRMKSKLEDLRAQNSDIVGFIHVSGTKISYPITQYEDNDYYLDHSFDKKPLKSGTIFMDCRNEKSFRENKNIVIYGHNMTNGSMFGNVTKFYKKADFFENTPIVIYTFDGIYTFEVFSIYQTRSDYKYYTTKFDTDEEFLDFLAEVKGNSVHYKEMDFDKDDLIVTLSTCTNGNSKGRYALHAKLTKIDN